MNVLKMAVIHFVKNNQIESNNSTAHPVIIAIIHSICSYCCTTSAPQPVSVSVEASTSGQTLCSCQTSLTMDD